MREFHSTNDMLGSFVVSVFILGYMVGPFVIAPLSEMYGRVPLYHTCNILFLIFTIACAVAQSLPQLIVFRLLAGVAGVCPLTIGSGTVADMVPKEKRAGIIAVWAMGAILGPIIGPVAGGFLAEAEGWRWVFWVIAIAVCLFHSSHRLSMLTNAFLDRLSDCQLHVALPRILRPRPPTPKSRPSAQGNQQPSALFDP